VTTGDGRPFGTSEVISGRFDPVFQSAPDKEKATADEKNLKKFRR
jgi:hypothetical protein